MHSQAAKLVTGVYFTANQIKIILNTLIFYPYWIAHRSVCDSESICQPTRIFHLLVSMTEQPPGAVQILAY